MKILGIDTSSQACSCAITSEGKLIGETLLNSGLNHSRTIMPAVENLIETSGMKIGDIDLFVSVAGPGSFTGVRIGVCAVKALCLGLNKPCAKIDTLEAMAYGAPYEGLISPILDARRNQVYTALFERTNGVFKRLSEDVALPLEEWLKQFCGKRVYFTGDGLDVHESFIRDTLGTNAIIADGSLRPLRASSACMLAQSNPEYITDADRLAPIYLRLPQAERERNERLTRQKA